MQRILILMCCDLSDIYTIIGNNIKKYMGRSVWAETNQVEIYLDFET